MKISSKHYIAQLLLGYFGLMLFLGAAELFPIPMAHLLPKWVSYFGLVLFFIAIVSGIGIGPWGKLVNKHIVNEDREYRDTLKSANIWEESNDL